MAAIRACVAAARQRTRRQVSEAATMRNPARPPRLAAGRITEMTPLPSRSAAGRRHITCSVHRAADPR